MKANARDKPEIRKPRPEKNPKLEARRAIRQPGRAKENCPAIYRWDSARPNSVSPAGTKGVPRSVHPGLFRPSGTGGKVECVYPAMNRWAIFGRPCGTKGDEAAKVTELTSIWWTGPFSEGEQNCQTKPMATWLMYGVPPSGGQGSTNRMQPRISTPLPGERPTG
jgi:hypothetical protein